MCLLGPCTATYSGLLSLNNILVAGIILKNVFVTKKKIILSEVILRSGAIYLTTLPIRSDRIVGSLMNGDLERFWKKCVVA
jgi:hypothetical protein